MKKVTIYSTPTCHFCHMTKEFFDANTIKYKDFNVATDMDKRKEMMQKSSQLGVPVIVIDDQVIVGFDKPKLSRLLGVN